MMAEKLAQLMEQAKEVMSAVNSVQMNVMWLERL